MRARRRQRPGQLNITEQRTKAFKETLPCTEKRATSICRVPPAVARCRVENVLTGFYTSFYNDLPPSCVSNRRSGVGASSTTMPHCGKP